MRPLALATVGLVAAGVALLGYQALQPTSSPPALADPFGVVAPQPAPSGWIDHPATEAIFSDTLFVDGWAIAPAGMRAVEVRMGTSAMIARYGLPRPDVGAAKPSAAGSANSGFTYSNTFADLQLLRHPFSVVAVDNQGKETTLGRRSLVPTGAMAMWSAVAPATSANPFYFLMATSGVAQGGAAEVPLAYVGYGSSTQQVGVAVPILYLRTTKGKDGDWVFDPGFDVTRKCGDRVVAEDSLDGILEFSIRTRTPVQFIMNGGIWADAGCDIPEWDVNDYLEANPANCQWTQDNKVHPDDYLKNLSGSTASPDLARSLSFNVYAKDMRHYKRRNLKAAATRIAKFGAEHPELFVGINLDSDTYVNPFYEQREWFDYNPQTLRQFREWLQGVGPYATPVGDVDLRRFRRDKSLTLAQVNSLARMQWKLWSDVEPPRRFPGSEHSPLKAGETLIWDDPWYQVWDTFRKQLVANHYDDLARWAHEAGIPKRKIFTAQGFSGPEGSAKPFAVYLSGVGQNYDSGGVSVEGSIPRTGHLGAILYGPAAENQVRMESRHGLFATFARMDPGWAVVETNVADLKQPQRYPTYAQSYRAFRDLFNYDARQVSLMAWNGSNGLFAGQPGYVSYTSWRNTPAEEAMRDQLVSHANLPRGSRLWTFGSMQHVDDDGWSVEDGLLATAPGKVTATAKEGGVTLLSPGDQVIRRANAEALILGIKQEDWTSIQIAAELEPGSGWKSLGELNKAEGPDNAAGVVVPLHWPWAKDAIAERVRIVIKLADGRNALEVARVSLRGATN